MPQETSAGGVVLRRCRGRVEACVIVRSRHQRHAWCLPKGHLESQETPPDAAVREVREETGYTSEILEPLGVIAYQFLDPGDRTMRDKTVHFFLMRPSRTAVVPHDATEVLEVRWLPLPEAVARASYENERALLKHAQRLIEQPELAARIPEMCA